MHFYHFYSLCYHLFFSLLLLQQQNHVVVVSAMIRRASSSTQQRQGVSQQQQQNMDSYDYWLDKNDFVLHITHIASFAGTKNLSHVPGFTRKARRKLFDIAKKKPHLIDSIVNLSEFVQGRRMVDVTKNDVVPDVAGAHHRLVDTSVNTCANPFGQSNPGVHNSDGNERDATPI